MIILFNLFQNYVFNDSSNNPSNNPSNNYFVSISNLLFNERETSTPLRKKLSRSNISVKKIIFSPKQNIPSLDKIKNKLKNKLNSSKYIDNIKKEYELKKKKQLNYFMRNGVVIV